MESETVRWRVLDFYSGIGGMHYALRDAAGKFEAEVVEAFDINLNANSVYEENFQTKVKRISIESLTKKRVDAYRADIWLLSPPCQPYTRQGFFHLFLTTGIQRGSEDMRAKSFIHLIKLLPTLENPPTFLLMENVKGFELSDTHQILTETLTANGYSFQEFLLSPNQFSFPNSRLRYFLLAKRTPQRFSVTLEGISQEIPGVEMLSGASDSEETEQVIRRRAEKCLPVEHFLDPTATLEEFAVPEDKVLKYGFSMGLSFFPLTKDLVTPSSQRTTCFTKGYGNYCEGTGSVLQTKEGQGESGNPSSLLLLGFRFFTPLEIAKLHGFPALHFPDTLTRRQCYKLLGNSLSVPVVSNLLSYLLCE